MSSDMFAIFGLDFIDAPYLSIEKEKDDKEGCIVEVKQGIMITLRLQPYGGEIVSGSLAKEKAQLALDERDKKKVDIVLSDDIKVIRQPFGLGLDLQVPIKEILDSASQTLSLTKAEYELKRKEIPQSLLNEIKKEGFVVVEEEVDSHLNLYKFPKKEDQHEQEVGRGMLEGVDVQQLTEVVQNIDYVFTFSLSTVNQLEASISHLQPGLASMPIH
eukprot:m.337619 g.337619  ORF g.337619 m.337619 type:complete len:216 (+) comp18183_c0_seq1:146-793(+)